MQVKTQLPPCWHGQQVSVRKLLYVSLMKIIYFFLVWRATKLNRFLFSLVFVLFCFVFVCLLCLIWFGLKGCCCLLLVECAQFRLSAIGAKEVILALGSQSMISYLIKKYYAFHLDFFVHCVQTTPLLFEFSTGQFADYIPNMQAILTYILIPKRKVIYWPLVFCNWPPTWMCGPYSSYNIRESKWMSRPEWIPLGLLPSIWDPPPTILHPPILDR